MKRLFASIVCLGLAALVGVAMAGEKGTAKLEGTWIATGGNSDGKKLPDDFVAKIMLTVVIKDNTIIMKADDKVAVDGTVQIKPNVKPKQFDITHNIGEVKGKVDMSVYVLDGDTLKIAGYTGQTSLTKRPTEFPKEGDKGIDFFTLKRVTP